MRTAQLLGFPFFQDRPDWYKDSCARGVAWYFSMNFRKKPPTSWETPKQTCRNAQFSIEIKYVESRQWKKLRESWKQISFWKKGRQLGTYVKLKSNEFETIRIWKRKVRKGSENNFVKVKLWVCSQISKFIDLTKFSTNDEIIDYN